MLLLEKVFEIINRSGLNYCIQNKYEMMPEEIPSDIDMMYAGADERFLDQLVIKIAVDTELLITQKIVQGYYEYTYILSEPAPKKRFQLQLDFYRAISHKDYPNVMPAEEMLQRKRYYKCFFVPDYFDELKYMWIRRTIKCDMAEEHLKIAKYLFEKNPQKYAVALRNVFGETAAEAMLYILDNDDISYFYSHMGIFRKSVKEISMRNCRTKEFHYLYRKFQITDVIPKRIFRQTGISIAFLAPDGAGKSTAIALIEETCSGSFYGVEKLYFRPHFLENAGSYKLYHKTKEDDQNTDPHGKVINKKWKSILRFFFYNIDFIFGTLCKILPLKIKKKLVIFDRYYYDYFADMRRYQYDLSAGFAKTFAWSIPRPDLIFVLDAPSELLYARKQELPLEELDRQRKIYREFAAGEKRAYLIDARQSPALVAEDITKIVLRYKAKQTAKLMRCKTDEEGYPII